MKKRIAPVLVRVKGEVPESILRYKGTAKHFIYEQWKGHRVELYGKIIPGYGEKAPFNRDHISARLAKTDQTAAFTAVALDEIVDTVDFDKLPKKPSFSGTPTYFRHR